MSAVSLSANFPINMQVRYNRYHYRRRVPADLVALLGRREITKSLHTNKANDGVRLKNQLDAQLEKLFQACRFSAVSAETAQAHLSTILHTGIAPSFSETAETLPAAISSKPRGKRLSDAIEAYCKENENRWTTKTKREFSGMFDRLLKGLADPSLKSMDRPSLVEYRNGLAAEGRHAKTINKYMQLLSSVLRHAGRLKWIQGNPAEGLGLQDSRREDEIRRAFTLDELKVIFTALQRDKQTFYNQDHHERYWLPLLGFYTGARVNELAQLALTDITTEDDIPCIAITTLGDDDKRLKNETSRRSLPIHQDLLTLGFLVYVRNMREAGHTRLFPALLLGPNGYSHYFVSRHFSGSKGWLRKQLPNLEAGMAFHSFRHLFASMLKNAEEPERLIEELMGHKHSSLSMGRYGKPYKMELRARAVNSIRYGLIPEVQEITKEEWNEETEEMLTIDCVVCGQQEIVMDIDTGRKPLAIKQYARPDLHGYSVFHSEITGFVQD